MKIRYPSGLEIAIAATAALYSIYLIMVNPQPFGKVGLLAAIGFALCSLINITWLRRGLQVVTILAALLFCVLGTRSHLLNIKNQSLFDKPTAVKFSDLDHVDVLQEAERLQKPIFIDFYTVWCPPCHVFHNEVLNDSEVAEHMNQAFINTKYNLYKGDGLWLKEKYDVYYVPRLLIIDHEGQILEDISTDTRMTKESIIQITKDYL